MLLSSELSLRQFPKQGGELLKLRVGDDYADFKGSAKETMCTYKQLPKSVDVGGRILMADGSVALAVASAGADHVMCKILYHVTWVCRQFFNALVSVGYLVFDVHILIGLDKI